MRAEEVRGGMKVATQPGIKPSADALLLAGFMIHITTGRLLDMGTGCGIVALAARGLGRGARYRLRVDAPAFRRDPSNGQGDSAVLEEPE